MCLKIKKRVWESLQKSNAAYFRLSGILMKREANHLTV